MKPILALVVLTALLPTSALLAADKEKAATTPSIEERLTRVDLAVTIKQYKKVRGMEQEMALQAEMQGNLPEGMSDKDRKAMDIRLSVLRRAAEQLRERAVQYDAVIRKHHEVAAAEKGK